MTKQYQTLKVAGQPFLDYFRLFKLPEKKKSSVSKYGKNNQISLDLKTTV